MKLVPRDLYSDAGLCRVEYRDLKAKPYPYHGLRETAKSTDNETALVYNEEFKKRVGEDHECVARWILKTLPTP